MPGEIKNGILTILPFISINTIENHSPKDKFIKTLNLLKN
jgi:hypothetical protein